MSAPKRAAVVYYRRLLELAAGDPAAIYAERAACGVCVRCAGTRGGATVYCQACLDRYAIYQGRTRRRARATSTDNSEGGRPV